MIKYILHNADHRHAVYIPSSGTYIECRLEIKAPRKWYHISAWWRPVSRFYRFEFQKRSLSGTKHGCIKTFTTDAGNVLEIWLIDEFDLQKRLSELFEEYKERTEQLNKVTNTIQNFFKNL